MNPAHQRLADALSDRYRIERELGAGGMATVFLAEDLRHDRKVAIKVLKPELAAVLGAERFVQEIKTTAAMSHPHILPLFDSGTADGFLYYVMPYIAGETIRERLNRETQFGVEDAVRIAREVADALDYAHRHGVIHRDIKPENILLHDRRALVMDFGIALAVSAAAGGRMTETGLSLGTPHYMSPEQATADKDITARSDVYSLASVLYEMLAGEPPHMGNSAQQIIMKIIAEPVQPVTALRKSVPPNVAAALAKALEKLPADRFEDAADFGAALADRSFGTDVSTAASGRVPGSNWRQRVAVPALVLLALVASVNLYQWIRPAPAPPVKRYEMLLDGFNEAEVFRAFALSPDGTRLVYSKAVPGGSRLAARSVDQLESRELSGTDGAINPFFSPDGKSVGFMIGGSLLKVVSFDGGGPITVADSGVGSPGATWSADGNIYFDQRGTGPLLKVRANGGTRPEPASQLDSTTGEQQHVWPEALPDGRGVLMVVNYTGPGRQGGETDRIAVLDLRTGRHRILVPGVYAKYAASGHLLYVLPDGTLMAVRFDPDKLTMEGDPVPVAEQVRVGASGSATVNLSLSETGTLWYVAGSEAYRRRALNWISPQGEVTPVDTGWAGDIVGVSLSPEATRAAMILRRSDGSHVWVRDLKRDGALNKVTFEGDNDLAWWSDDGRSIHFQSLRSASKAGVWRVSADGSGAPTAVLQNVPQVRSGSWTRDGSWFVFSDLASDLYAIRPGVDTVPRAIVRSPAIEVEPHLSPDGRWLAYTSTRTGQREVYVSPFPNTDQSLTQVSADGGSAPRWSPDGQSIVYRGAAGLTFVTVRVRTSPTFAVVSRHSIAPGAGFLSWDVGPNGRILAVRRPDVVGSGRHIVVENFLEELERKLPR